MRLASDVVQRISAIDRRPTIGDHPAIKVPGAPEAGCDHAPVAIVIARFAAHGGAADIIRQCEGCLLAAAPGRAVRSDAFLAALEGINAMHAEARTMNFERLAIDIEHATECDAGGCHPCRSPNQPRAASGAAQSSLLRRAGCRGTPPPISSSPEAVSNLDLTLDTRRSL